MYRPQWDPYFSTPYAFRGGNFPPPCPPPPHHVATLPKGWQLKTHRKWMATLPARAVGNPHSTRSIKPPDRDMRGSGFCVREGLVVLPATACRPALK